MIWFVLFLAAIIVGSPIAVSMAVVAMPYILTHGGDLLTVPQRFITGMDSFPFIAIPLFLLVGELMSRGGATKRLVELAYTLVGWVPGGLGHVNVVANLFMSGVSGSAVADASATGSILVPMMAEKGFSPGFSAAITAAAATVGPVIPPSIPLVLIGSLTGISIGKLFLGGVVPGLVMGLYLMIAVFLISRTRGYQVASYPKLGVIARAFLDSLPALLLPLIIVGGIIGGIFTATESAAVACVYALLLGFAYREIKFRDLPAIFVRSMLTSSQVMFVIGAANVLAWLIARERVPFLLTGALTHLSSNPWVILTILNVGLLVWGCFMETAASIVLLTPILYPVAHAFGIDPIQFGVVVTVNLMIGLITPPIGMNMFVLMTIAKIPMMSFAKEVLPFLIALVLALAVITYVPDVVTWLPNLLMK